MVPGQPELVGGSPAHGVCGGELELGYLCSPNGMIRRYPVTQRTHLADELTAPQPGIGDHPAEPAHPGPPQHVAPPSQDGRRRSSPIHPQLSDPVCSLPAPPGPAGVALPAGGPQSRSRMEMELPLGWEFEEAVFSQSRERGAGGGAGPPYSAKRCEPRWFCAETSSEEDAEVLTAHKFRADLAYRERQFEKALCEYSNCLQRLPPGNIAMRRDVQEGQARCLSQLGRHKEALDIAEGMRNSATNTDHLTTVLNLQFAIYRDPENIEKKMVCLQQLICLHPFNPWYWKSLAEAYMDLLQSLSPLHIPEANLNQSKEVSDDSFKMSAGGEIDLQPHRSDCQREGPQSGPEAETRSESAETCSSSQAVTETLRTSDSAGRKAEGKQAACESWEPDMAKDVGVKACASFVRARLLLQLTQLQQSSFALENNIKCQKEIDYKVAQFGLNENSLLQVTKVMGADLVPEKLKEEFQGEVKCIGSSALSSLVTTSASEFEIKWFDILRDDLRHLDGQFSPDIHIPPLAT